MATGYASLANVSTQVIMTAGYASSADVPTQVIMTTGYASLATVSTQVILTAGYASFADVSTQVIVTTILKPLQVVEFCRYPAADEAQYVQANKTTDVLEYITPPR
jgi:hypothetical protein